MTLIEPRWDDARAALAEAVRALPPVRLPIDQCDRLVLAEDLAARIALPSFDTSAMDGWAVAGAGPWAIVGESLAGRPWPERLEAGRAVAIATGGVVPEGAEAVIRSEDGRIGRSSAGDEVLHRRHLGGQTGLRPGPGGSACPGPRPGLV